MFLLLMYLPVLFLPFLTPNLTYRAATVFTAMIVIVDMAIFYGGFLFSSQDPLYREGAILHVTMFLPVLLFFSLIIGALLLPQAIRSSSTYTRTAIVIGIVTVGILYLSNALLLLLANLFFSSHLSGIWDYLILTFASISDAKWEHLSLAANIAFSAMATITIVRHWSSPNTQ